MRGAIALTALLAFVVAPGPARGESVTIEPSKDNTLFENEAGALSNGAGPVFFVGANSQLNRRRGVIAFDPAAALPDSAVVDSVVLTLHLSNASNELVRRIEIHRLTAAWGEGTSNATGGSGATSTTGDATWLHRFYPDLAWSSAGGDLEAGVRSTADVTGVGFYAWSGDSLTADVQRWTDHPETNFGWILVGEEDVASSARRFDTRENGTPIFRPALTIYYTPGQTPVTPSTWSRIKSRIGR